MCWRHMPMTCHSLTGLILLLSSLFAQIPNGQKHFFSFNILRVFSIYNNKVNQNDCCICFTPYKNSIFKNPNFVTKTNLLLCIFFFFFHKPCQTLLTTTKSIKLSFFLPQSWTRGCSDFQKGMVCQRCLFC